MIGPLVSIGVGLVVFLIGLFLKLHAKVAASRVSSKDAKSTGSASAHA